MRFKIGRHDTLDVVEFRKEVIMSCDVVASCKCSFLLNKDGIRIMTSPLERATSTRIKLCHLNMASLLYRTSIPEAVSIQPLFKLVWLPHADARFSLTKMASA